MTNCDHLKNSWKKMGQCLHNRNIQSLVVEMLEMKHGQSPEIVTDILTQTKRQYNFVQNRDCRVPVVNTAYHGSGSISYLGHKIWEIVPVKIKDANSVNSFKKEIRQQAPQNYPCRLCKQYKSGVFFFHDLRLYINICFIILSLHSNDLHVFIFMF